MTIKRSLSAVRDALEALTGVIREVAVSVDDIAAEGELAVLDALRAHAAEVEGELAGIASALQLAAKAEEQGDAARAARALSEAHERFSGTSRRVRFGLSSHDSLFALRGLAARRGGPWRAGSELVLGQLERVDDALHHTDAALVAAWQEFADVALHAPTHPRQRKEIVHD